MSESIITSNGINLIKEIFKSQSFLLKNNKDSFLVDDGKITLLNFKSFPLVKDKEKVLKFIREELTKKSTVLLGDIPNLSLSEEKKALFIELLQDYAENCEIAKDGELKPYYDKISALFDISEQQVIGTIDHVFSTFTIKQNNINYYFVLLSLVMPDGFVHRNNLKLI